MPEPPPARCRRKRRGVEVFAAAPAAAMTSVSGSVARLTAIPLVTRFRERLRRTLPADHVATQGDDFDAFDELVLTQADVVIERLVFPGHGRRTLLHEQVDEGTGDGCAHRELDQVF